jgi:hypothetical protein
MNAEAPRGILVALVAALQNMLFNGIAVEDTTRVMSTACLPPNAEHV